MPTHKTTRLSTRVADLGLSFRARVTSDAPEHSKELASNAIKDSLARGCFKTAGAARTPDRTSYRARGLIESSCLNQCQCLISTKVFARHPPAATPGFLGINGLQPAAAHFVSMVEARHIRLDVQQGRAIQDVDLFEV